MPENKTKILAALSDFSTVMFGTHTVGGLVEFRPMAIASKKNDSFYFICSQNSGKVLSIEKTHVITITAQSSSSYLTVIGKGEVVDDQPLIKEIWSPAFQAWFPGGPDDPNVALIKFIPKEGELWDNNLFAKANYIWEVITSNLTGKKANVEDEHNSFTS